MVVPMSKIIPGSLDDHAIRSIMKKNTDIINNNNVQLQIDTVNWEQESSKDSNRNARTATSNNSVKPVSASKASLKSNGNDSFQFGSSRLVYNYETMNSKNSTLNAPIKQQSSNSDASDEIYESPNSKCWWIISKSFN